MVSIIELNSIASCIDSGFSGRRIMDAIEMEKKSCSVLSHFPSHPGNIPISDNCKFVRDNRLRFIF